VAELIYTALSDVPVGETVVIRRVDTSQADRLRYLGASGLTPGTIVTVTSREPFDGPITLDHDGHHHMLGNELGRLLLCERPSPGAGEERGKP
jgi:Fe2+ transport system protein FeoA